MPTDVEPEDISVRVAAQERLLNAVMAVVSLRDPGFLGAVRNMILDANEARSQPPGGASELQLMLWRLDAVGRFTDAYRGEG